MSFLSLLIRRSIGCSKKLNYPLIKLQFVTKTVFVVCYRFTKFSAYLKELIVHEFKN